LADVAGAEEPERRERRRESLVAGRVRVARSQRGDRFRRRLCVTQPKGFGKVGEPQLGPFKREFASAARKTGVDEAWLRAIAHAESYFAADAVSDKGAKGVMQLMPDVIADYGVADPFSASQSIYAGAKYLKTLEAQYEGDRILTAAAYNAGPGAVEQYHGVPPYDETRQYVAKVAALYASYRKAMGLAPRSIELTPAQ